MSVSHINALPSAVASVLASALAVDPSNESSNALHDALITILIKAFQFDRRAHNGFPSLLNTSVPRENLYFLCGHYDTVASPKAHLRPGALLPEPTSQDIVNPLSWAEIREELRKEPAMKPSWNMKVTDDDSKELSSFLASVAIMVRGKGKRTDDASSTLEAQNVQLDSITINDDYVLERLNTPESIAYVKKRERWFGLRKNKLYMVNGIQWAKIVKVNKVSKKDTSFEAKVVVDPFGYIEKAVNSAALIGDAITTLTDLIAAWKDKGNKSVLDAISVALKDAQAAEIEAEKARPAQVEAQKEYNKDKTAENQEKLSKASEEVANAVDKANAAKERAQVAANKASDPEKPIGIGFDSGYKNARTVEDGYTAERVFICYSLSKIKFKLIEDKARPEVGWKVDPGSLERTEYKKGDIKGIQIPQSVKVEQLSSPAKGPIKLRQELSESLQLHRYVLA